jgi:heavy metal translocating P-type ATPase
MSGSAREPACQHCGLATAEAGAYCCYGCELAARIAAEGRERRTELYGVITFSLLLSMIVMMLSLFLFAEDVYGAGAEAGLVWMRTAYRVASAVLSTPVVLMLGVPLARRALGALRARRLTMDLLVAAGAAAAYGISIASVLRGRGGVYFDSATSALLLSTLGRYLEATARAAASRVIGPSLALGGKPVLAADGAGVFRPVSPASITPGQRLRIEVEEVLPVDAILAGPGGVEVTLGVITGAAAPALREAGDELPAGAVPVSGAIECVALRPARESTLERLAELSRSLKERPSRLSRLADGFAAVLVPAVALLALVTLVTTAARSSLEGAVIASLAVVLAACPCTYGVATPLVLWLALRKALEKGVCIRSAAAIEELARVTTVAFDKTGTLTSPDLAVLGAALAPGVAPAEVKGLVAALEAGSRHPVARALDRWAGAEPGAIEDRRVIAGSGVEGHDAAGRRVLLGSARWLGEHGVLVAQQHGDDADVRVALARGGEVLARFAIGEAARPEAAAAVRALRAEGVAALVLTGDTEAGARAIARPLGIEARAALSPVAKLAELERLGKRVAMVGDGVNDAPALASVGPSFAMGGGTGLSRGLSQVTLLTEDLRLVPWTLALSRRAMQVGWQNLWASTIYNLVFLALAATGSLRPVWAGLSMLGSSLLTLASSLRVSAVADPEGARPAHEETVEVRGREAALEGGLS